MSGRAQRSLAAALLFKLRPAGRDPRPAIAEQIVLPQRATLKAQRVIQQVVLAGIAGPSGSCLARLRPHQVVNVSPERPSSGALCLGDCATAGLPNLIHQTAGAYARCVPHTAGQGARTRCNCRTHANLAVSIRISRKPCGQPSKVDGICVNGCSSAGIQCLYGMACAARRTLNCYTAHATAAANMTDNINGLVGRED
jgi:hypothetical protein